MNKPETTAPPLPKDVLIAEDSATQAARLKAALETHGWSVRVAGDGVGALAMARLSKPGIVVSDIRMPNMDGYALSKAIKTDPGLHDVPVVLLTSLSQSSDIIDAINSRADYYFLKQWDYDVLIAKIESVLATYQPFPDQGRGGLTVHVDGATYTIEANAQQPLHLLLSTYEIAVQQSLELARSRDELRAHRDQLEMLVTERTAALTASETRYRRLFESAKDGILILDAETGMVVDVNPFLIELLGFSHEAFLGKKVWELGFLKDLVANQARFGKLRQKGYVRYEDLPLETAAGRRIAVEFVSNVYLVDSHRVIQCNIRDNTEHNLRQRQQKLAMRVLEALNRQNDVALLVQDILHLIKEHTGIEAVGIRLRDGDDFPYFVTNGFSGDFVEAERQLCVRDAAGKLIRDSAGNPVLECMCGNVLRCRFDPAKPFFTEQGSFWSNNTTELLASTTETDRQSRTRNRCNGEGYESVALVPLRSGDEVIGLLQLNDRRKGMFTLDMIQFFEGIGASIGIAVARKRTADELQAAAKFPAENKDPVLRIAKDGTLLYANAAASSQLADWLPQTGQPAPAVLRDAACRSLDQGSDQSIDIEYGERVYSFSVAPIAEAGYANLYGRDTTDRKRAEQRVEHLNRVLRAIRHVNQLIARERDPQALIQQACAILVEHRSYLGAMIILTDDEGKPRTYAQVGMTEGFQPLAEHLGQGILPPCCESAKAHAGDGVHLVTDRAAVCGGCPVAGYCAHSDTMRMPLRHGEEVLGFLMVPAEHVDAIDAEEQSLFAEMAGDVAFALRSIATEAARDESDLTLRTIFDGATDGMLLADAETRRFVNANQTMCRMLGYSMEEVRHLSVEDIHPAESLHDVAAAFEKQMRGGITLALDIPVKRKDASVFFAEVSSSPITLAGRPHLLGIFRDITERRTMEAQMRQAQKMESVGRLAGGVAHDFNNLLMGVMGYVELCRDGLEPDHPIREWLDEITADSERSANLTRQLLAFARKQIIAPKVLDLNDTVASMLKLLRRLIGEDIDLAWLPGPGLGTVKMDPSQVDQILANLTVNARDAIGGVGKLTIETENVTLDAAYCAEHAGFVPGEYVLLSVSDDGCGMDAETREHIFEPFFTTKGVGEGTGLGLATVYGIVKQNNGFINVYSEPGNGTTFKIYLSRHRGETVGEADAAAPAALPGGNETILLVEDEKSIRVTAALFLEAFGYTVLAADCPEQALRLAAAHPGQIHLLITDVVMPGQSGRDLATQLASDRPQMKRLFMSGYTADVIAHRGVLDEGVEFLGKPFTRDDLARKVRKVLEA